MNRKKELLNALPHMKNVAESNFICFKFLLFSLLWHWFCKIIPGYHTGPFNTRMTESVLAFFFLTEREKKRENIIHKIEFRIWGTREKLHVILFPSSTWVFGFCF